MESLVTSLKDLLDLKKVASITLPGVATAAILALLLWPPRPLDVIPIVTAPKLGITAANNQVFIKSLLRPRLNGANDPSCSVEEYQLKQLPGGMKLASEEYEQASRSRQFELEEQNGNLDACLAVENRMAGREKAQNEHSQRDLKAAEAARGAASSVVAAFARVGSPLLGSAQFQLASEENQVEQLRNQILANEQTTRNREWEIAELTRFKRMVSERLADPGKLRPQLAFDDYMAALSNHLVAFIALSMTVGILLQAVFTPAILGGLYELFFQTSET